MIGKESSSKHPSGDLLRVRNAENAGKWEKREAAGGATAEKMDLWEEKEMEKTAVKHGMSTAQMTVTALMTAITCILAPMALPIPVSPVPISLTNLVIFFMAYILGAKLSVASYVLYLLLGMVGLPVFSGFTGGVGKLLGPTGGYLIGFIFLAAIAGFFVEKFPAKIYMHVIGMIIGMAVCYAFGTAWLANQLGMSFVAGLGVGVIPYLPGDTAKIIIAIIAGPQIRKAVSRFM